MEPPSLTLFEFQEKETTTHFSCSIIITKLLSRKAQCFAHCNVYFVDDSELHPCKESYERTTCRNNNTPLTSPSTEVYGIHINRQTAGLYIQQSLKSSEVCCPSQLFSSN